LSHKRVATELIIFVFFLMQLGTKAVSSQGSRDVIVYQDSTRRFGQICITDTGRKTCLTNDLNGENWAPLWSPDKKFIAFLSNRAGSRGLYVMDANGRKLSEVMTFQSQNESATFEWTSTGSHLVIDLIRRVENGYQLTLYLADPYGEKCVLFSQPSETTRSPICHSGSLQNRILFHVINDGSMNVFSMEPNSLSSTQLTHATHAVYSGALSPDGKHIALLYHKLPESENLNPQLYIMQADGTNLRYIIDLHASPAPYRWSPDSTQIAFTAQREGDRHPSINVVAIHELEIRQLTDGDTIDILEDWSPDGQQIVFSRLSNPFEPWKMIVVNSDGTDPHVVVECGNRRCEADW